MNVFTDPNHHGCSGTHVQLMGFAMNHQPIVRLTFQGTDRGANFVIENLAAASGHRIQACHFEVFEHFLHRHLRYLRDVQDLRWRETMAVNAKSFFDSREKAFVVIDLQVRMNSSLH